jgi:hypothetical protein
MLYYCSTIFLSFFSLLCSITFLACNQDDDISPTSNDLQSVSAFLIAENGLMITLLTDDEDNETYYFDSYLFYFDSDGSVVATDDNETVNGTYSVFRDDGRVELRMNFPSIQNFDELNDDWYFISIDQNVIRFDDDGDRLEFQKL